MQNMLKKDDRVSGKRNWVWWEREGGAEREELLPKSKYFLCWQQLSSRRH